MTTLNVKGPVFMVKDKDSSKFNHLLLVEQQYSTNIESHNRI